MPTSTIPTQNHLRMATAHTRDIIKGISLFNTAKKISTYLLQERTCQTLTTSLMYVTYLHNTLTLSTVATHYTFLTTITHS